MLFVVKSEIQDLKSKIVIAGAGPAGASLAIRLAKQNFDVVLIEREKFPREKLCGEFISPECLAHFQELGVLNEMLAVGGDRIVQTTFYEPNGKSVTVPSEWLDRSGQGALSISRAEMDLHLLERAKEMGVDVLEQTQVVGILSEKDKICGVRAKDEFGQTREIPAGLMIDATGRANVLANLAKKFKAQSSKLEAGKIKNQKPKTKNRLVGFKTHLKKVNLEKGRCEIYFFQGGYGGLSFVENDLANHCFLISADFVKEFSGDVNKIVENVVFQNKRAYLTLKDAEPVHDWLAVSVDGFGVRSLNPAENIFTAGDAAAFIDPFTGSGMLMALESAEILAKCISQNHLSTEKIAEAYKFLHRRKFHKRLWICGLMRRAAFVPSLAKTVISVLSYSEKAREILAHSTRKAFLAKENK